MIDDPLPRIREAIRGESLDGWLFYNFRHRDRLSDEILGIDADASNTRPWAYAVPSDGVPLKIVHAIEPRILDSLPGDAAAYVERSAFFAAFKAFAGQRWAAQVSGELPVLSFLDAGTADGIRSAGVSLESAAPLIQRLKGLLDGRDIASHERAADALYGIVEIAWKRVGDAYRNRSPIDEGGIRRLILALMEERGLETDHPPIVAAGSNSGNPHYDFSGDGLPFKEGDVIQLDLWAREKTPKSIYADISWVGVFGEVPSEVTARAWKALIGARERAVDFIGGEFLAGRPTTGAAVDEQVRTVLIDAGYGTALRHRTGHGIDTECHGSGVNLDSIEFPDRRLLLEGSCFSVEPGLYFPNFGLRTEIDVYIHDGRPRVSGKERQRDILRCGRSAF